MKAGEDEVLTKIKKLKGSVTNKLKEMEVIIYKEGELQFGCKERREPAFHD